MNPTPARRPAAALAFTWHYILFNLRCAMEYRLSFVTQVVFMFVNDIFLLFFWWVFFHTFRAVRGWEMADVLMLYALGTGSFGLAFTVCGNARRLSQLIAAGQLDYYLALPRQPLWHLLISYMEVSALGDLLFGLALYCFTGAPSLGGFCLLLAMIAAGAAILVCCAVLAHCLTFVFGNNDGFAQMYTQILVTLSMYPRNIFTGVVQFALFTVLPAGFMTYLPAQIVRNFDLLKAAEVLAFTAVLVLLTNLAFTRGLRRYESGNLLAAHG